MNGVIVAWGVIFAFVFGGVAVGFWWRLRDPMHPLVLVPGLQCLFTAPYLIAAGVNPRFLGEQLLRHPSVQDLEIAVSVYGLAHLVAFTALLVGLSWVGSSRLGRRLPALGVRTTPVRLWMAVAVGVVVGVGAIWWFVQEVGGLSFWMANLHRRASLTEGYGYLTSAGVFLTWAVLAAVLGLKRGRTLKAVSGVFLLCVLAIAVFSLLGGRKQSLQLVVLVLIAYHYGVRRLRRPALVAACLFLLVVPYVTMMGALRAPEGRGLLMEAPREFAMRALTAGGHIVARVSFVDHYVLVVNHFTPQRLWLGASVTDLLYAPIPSRLLRDKPPIDEGMYLRTIATGRHVKPSIPRNELFPSSWPPETFGVAFMNFWWPGLILAFLMLGIIYRAAFEYMKHTSYSLWGIAIYGIVVLNFELSNLRLVQCVVMLATLWCFCVVFFGRLTDVKKVDVNGLGRSLARRPPVQRRGCGRTSSVGEIR